MEAWFNWTGEERGKIVNNIIRKSNYGSGAGSGYWLRIGQDLEFSVGATTQAEGQTIITAPVSAGVWHHAVGTKDSSGDVKLYVDGQSQGTVIRQAANTQSTSGSAFTIGAWNGQYSEFFHGLIDEVSVYNKALSASEVQSIFNAGSAGKCSADSGMGTNYSLPKGTDVNLDHQPGDADKPILPYSDQYQQQYQQSPLVPQYIQPSGGASYEIPITPELCAGFKEVPACSYVGAPDSQNYQLCKKCYPAK